MTKKPTILLTPNQEILEARAITILINLLETAFKTCDQTDQLRLHLLQIELSIAYKALMHNHEATKRLIQLTKVS